MNWTLLPSQSLSNLKKQNASQLFLNFLTQKKLPLKKGTKGFFFFFFVLGTKKLWNYLPNDLYTLINIYQVVWSMHAWMKSELRKSFHHFLCKQEDERHISSKKKERKKENKQESFWSRRKKKKECRHKIRNNRSKQQCIYLLFLNHPVYSISAVCIPKGVVFA